MPWWAGSGGPRRCCLGSGLEVDVGLRQHGSARAPPGRVPALTFSWSIPLRSPHGANSWAKAKCRGVCRGSPSVCSRPGCEDTQRPTQNSLRKVALGTESRRRSLRATVRPAGRQERDVVLGSAARPQQLPPFFEPQGPLATQPSQLEGSPRMYPAVLWHQGSASSLGSLGDPLCGTGVHSPPWRGWARITRP